MSSTPDERSNQVKRIARMIAPKMEEFVRYEEDPAALYVSMDARGPGLQGISILLLDMEWSDETALMMVTALIAHSIDHRLYGKPPSVGSKPTEEQREERLSEHFRHGRYLRQLVRLDRIAITLLVNARVANALDRYCAYLCKIAEHSTDARMAALHKRREKELRKFKTS